MKSNIAFEKVYSCLDSECRFVIDKELSTIETDPKDMPLTRKTLTLKDIQVTDEDENIVKGYISTRDVDHSLDLVVPEGIIIDVFKRNPVILWNHDNSKTPIAKCINLVVDSYGVLATIEFAPTEEAQDIKKLVKGSFLSSFSIGFIPLVATKKKDRSFVIDNESLKSKYPEYRGNAERIIKSWLILEASVVLLPDNPNAVITQKQITEMEIKSTTLELLNLKCSDCEEAQKEFKEKLEDAKTINREIKVIKEPTNEIDDFNKEYKKDMLEIKRATLEQKKNLLIELQERKNKLVEQKRLEAILTKKGKLVRY